ncbi:MAG: hypothetical protein ACREPN_02730 [Rudaea sp.]
MSGLACHTAHADDPAPLPPVEVTANVLGGTATIPIYMLPTVNSIIHPPINVTAANIDSMTIDMTKEQVCKMLRDHKPSNCSTSIYPPAPGIKSSSGAIWGGNGCGAGSTDPFTTALTSALFGKLNSNYSGNLNAPIKGRPDIDFTATCDSHDGWYTSSMTKQRADNLFARALTTQCGNVGDSAGQGACNTVSSEYQYAVDEKGANSYAEDQAQYQCAAWGDSMKKDGCGSD